MIKDALKYIVGLNEPKIIDYRGNKYSDKELEIIKEPLSEGLELNTLTGLVDYIKNDIDGFQNTDLIVHIKNYKTVEVISQLKENYDRHCFIRTTAQLPRIEFSRFLDTENFIIMMQSCFIDNEDKSKVLKVVGNIKEEVVKQVGDDGITQQVTAKSGVARIEEVELPNPVSLIPYRTFTEVGQPESKFVFRMKSGPSAALIEADGGAWKNQAVLNIKQYLENELKDIEYIQIIA